MIQFKMPRFSIVSVLSLAILTSCSFVPLPTPDGSSDDNPWAGVPAGQMRIVFSSDNSHLYVLQDLGMEGFLFILDGKSYDLLNRIPVGRRPIAMIIEGERGYVVNYLSDEINIIDLRAEKVIKTVSVGHRPIRIETSVVNPYLFVANYGSDTISVIDKKSLEVIKVIPVGHSPGDMAIHPDGRTLYAIHRGESGLWAIDLRFLRVTQKRFVGENPSDIVVSNDGRYLFVSDANINVLQVISTASLKNIQSIPAGIRPMEILRSPETGMLFVMNHGSRTILAVNPETLEEVFEIPLKHAPRCITSTSDGAQLYVSYGDRYSEISVIETAGNPSWASRDIQVIF